MRRKVILGLGLLVVLVAVVFVWLFTASTSREAIRARLAEMTGGVVRVDSVERLWWTPGVVLHGLELETEGFALEVDRLEVRVAFVPLLWGEVQPREVRLNDGRLIAKEGETRLPDLPWEATWEIHRLDFYAPVGEEEKQILHLRRASLATGLDGVTRLEVTGGASAEAPTSLQIQGEASGWREAPLPQARLALNLDDLPAQPLVGYLARDQKALATARLDGLLILTTQENTLIAEGRLRAESSFDEQLLEIQLRAQATPEGFTLDSASGTIVGNQVQANGTGRLREDGDWEVDLQADLADGHIDDDTLRLLHEALGREVLGFADHLRGRFTAEMELIASPERERIAGRVELRGMTYAAPGLPAIHDLRGRLMIEAPRVEFVGVSATVFNVPIQLKGTVRGRRIALEVQSEEVLLSELPLPAEADLPLESLMGIASATVNVDGRMEAPQVSGVVVLREAGFDFRRTQVRDVNAEAEFSLERAQFDALSGRVGGCSFLASGEFEPVAWRETAQVTLEIPNCELSALLQLAHQAEVASIPLLKPEELYGAGTITAEYRNQELDGRLAVEEGRWQPAWLALPVEQLSAQVGLDPTGIEVEELQGVLGASPVSIVGRVDLSQATPRWQMELGTKLQPPDLEQLLRGRGAQWLHFPGTVTGTAQLAGSATTGIRVQADFQLPVLVDGDEDGGENSNGGPADPPQLQLQGVWQDGVFALKQLAATVGATRLSGTGRVRLSPDQHLDLRLQAPPGSSVSDLLTVVRLPEVMGQPEGQLSADITVVGSPHDLEWGGAVSLEEVHLPELLTEPVSLNGRLELIREGIELREMEIRQPNGTFTMTGLLRPRGRSELQLRGAWANLDRLLGQVPERSYTVPRENQFLSRHPVRMTIDIDQVQFLGLVFNQVEGELEQADSQFTLRVPRFGVAAGHGGIEVAPMAGTDRMRIALDLEDLNTATLLKDLLKRPAAVAGPLNLSARLTGPLGPKETFLRDAEGEVNFTLGQGRLQRGTLPERLFALAVLLKEGLYGFGLSWLTRIGKPHDLDRFQEWTGAVRLEGGKAHIEKTELISKVYNVAMTGEMELESGRLQIHGEGNFHPGWEFDISLKAIVGLFSRLFRLARGRRGHDFEFDVSGTLGGRKSVENFRFKD